MQLIEEAAPEQHVVQLYGENVQLLIRSVARYLAEGLRRREGLVVIATSDHVVAIRRQLEHDGIGYAAALAQGWLVFADARDTLSRFLLNDGPDRRLFQEVVGGTIRSVRARAPAGRLRAFGEMVGLLWSEGRLPAAIELEAHWNELIKEGGFSLYCAYPIDLFGQDFDLAELRPILDAHRHISAGPCTLLSSPR